MKGIRCILVAAGLAAALAGAPRAAAVWPPGVGSAPPAAEVAKLVAAIGNSDLTAFVADGDAGFTAGARAAFDCAASRLRGRLQKGYGVVPLGELKQGGRQVTLWKVAFKDGGDDALATLTLAAGKVAAFALN